MPGDAVQFRTHTFTCMRECTAQTRRTLNTERCNTHHTTTPPHHTALRYTTPHDHFPQTCNDLKSTPTYHTTHEPHTLPSAIMNAAPGTSSTFTKTPTEEGLMQHNHATHTHMHMHTRGNKHEHCMHVHTTCPTHQTLLYYHVHTVHTPHGATRNHTLQNTGHHAPRTYIPARHRS